MDEPLAEATYPYLLVGRIFYLLDMMMPPYERLTCFMDNKTVADLVREAGRMGHPCSDTITRLHGQLADDAILDDGPSIMKPVNHFWALIGFDLQERELEKA